MQQKKIKTQLVLKGFFFLNNAYKKKKKHYIIYSEHQK